jgi:O-antigen ligase
MLDDRYLRILTRWLVVILLLKIAGYFTLSENVAVTRALKILLRTGMTVAIWTVYRDLRSRGAFAVREYGNLLVPVLYGAYLFLGFLSLFWSSDPAYSALQLGMIVESFVFAYYFVLVYRLVLHHRPDAGLRVSHLLSRSTGIILAIFLLGVLFLPDKFYRLTHGGEEARLGGYLMNPNELGMLCVVSAGMCCLELLNGAKKGWPVFFLLLAIIALVLTGSRSSLIGFTLVLLYFVSRSDNRRIKLVVVVGMVAALPLAVSTIIFKGGDVEEVMSMTGRVPFWTALLTEGLPKEPLFGFGFMRIAYRDYFQSVHTYAGQMTHNTFIQVVMNLGLIGLALVLIQVVATLIAFFRSSDRDLRKFFVALFIPILINSFTEFGIFGETNYGILFYQLLLFSLVIRVSSRMSLREQVLAQALQRKAGGRRVVS